MVIALSILGRIWRETKDIELLKKISDLLGSSIEETETMLDQSADLDD